MAVMLYMIALWQNLRFCSLNKKRPRILRYIYAVMQRVLRANNSDNNDAFS